MENEGPDPTSSPASDTSINSNTSRNSSLENSRNLKDKWPENLPPKKTRVSVSPSKEIEKIPEASPIAWSQDSRNDDSFQDDEADSSPPVYKSTTASNRRRSERKTDKEPLIVPSHDSLWQRLVARGKNWCSEMRASLRSFTKRQWLIMTVLAIVTLTSSFAVCLFPPFFPPIAIEKGNSNTIVGLIIGTNCLVAFLVTPTVGKNLERIGVKFSFVMGAFSSGCCCILSGFLEWFPPGYKFVLEAVCIRAVHACSNAFVITSTFAFIVVEFPDNIAKLFAMTRTMMSLAQMVGPVAGGALHEIGGFKLPFLVLGSVQITVALICIYALPKYRKNAKQAISKKRDIRLLDVLKIPSMWISFVTFIFSTMSNGFLSITLTETVKANFNVSHVYVGVLFGLKDGANSLASPLWGILCDWLTDVRPLILVSTVIAGSSFILLGPFPGLDMTWNVGLISKALIMNGIGIGGQQVAGVVHAMNSAVAADLPNDAVTHGFIAGLWSSLSGGGRFLSRSMAGILLDHLGWRVSTAIIVFLHYFVFIVTSGFLMGDRLHKYIGRPPAATDAQKPEKSEERQHSSDCTHSLCVCEPTNTFTSIAVNTPSDSVTSKAISIPMPGIREDLEGSMSYGSVRSNKLRHLASTSPVLASSSEAFCA